MTLDRKTLLQLTEKRGRIKGRDYLDVEFLGGQLRIQQLPADVGMDIAAAGTPNDAAASRVAVLNLLQACVVDEKFERIFQSIDEIENLLPSLHMADLNVLITAITEFVKFGDDEVRQAAENFTTTTNGASSSV